MAPNEDGLTPVDRWLQQIPQCDRLLFGRQWLHEHESWADAGFSRIKIDTWRKRVALWSGTLLLGVGFVERGNQRCAEIYKMVRRENIFTEWVVNSAEITPLLRSQGFLNLQNLESIPRSPSEGASRLLDQFTIPIPPDHREAKDAFFLRHLKLFLTVLDDKYDGRFLLGQGKLRDGNPFLTVFRRLPNEDAVRFTLSWKNDGNMGIISAFYDAYQWIPDRCGQSFLDLDRLTRKRDERDGNWPYLRGGSLPEFRYMAGDIVGAYYTRYRVRSFRGWLFDHLCEGRRLWGSWNVFKAEALKRRAAYQKAMEHEISFINFKCREGNPSAIFAESTDHRNFGTEMMRLLVESKERLERDRV